MIEDRGCVVAGFGAHEQFCCAKLLSELVKK